MLSIAARYTAPSFLRRACFIFLALSLVAFVAAFATYDGGPTIFGSSLGGDFVGFYTAATAPEPSYSAAAL